MRLAVFPIAQRETSVWEKQQRPCLADARRDRPNCVIVRRIDLREERKNSGLECPVWSKKLEVVSLVVVHARVDQGHEWILEDVT